MRNPSLIDQGIAGTVLLVICASIYGIARSMGWMGGKLIHNHNNS